MYIHFRELPLRGVSETKILVGGKMLQKIGVRSFCLTVMIKFLKKHKNFKQGRQEKKG